MASEERRHILALQRERLLKDKLAVLQDVGPLERYLQALAWLVTAADAAPGTALESDVSGTRDPSPIPDSRPGWVRDYLRRELRWLERQAQQAEEFVARPYPLKARRRRCEECGRGQAKGNAFCPGCGHQLPEQEEGT